MSSSIDDPTKQPIEGSKQFNLADSISASTDIKHFSNPDLGDIAYVPLTKSEVDVLLSNAKNADDFADQALQKMLMKADDSIKPEDFGNLTYDVYVSLKASLKSRLPVYVKPS